MSIAIYLNKGVLVDQGSQIISSPKKRLNLTRSHLVILIALLLLTIAGLVTYILTDNGDEELQPPKTVEYAETVTPTAFSNYLSVALEAFYSGGNTNGVNVPANNYYPSTADLKDLAWSQKNVQLDENTVKQINSGEIQYIPTGCDASRPTNQANRCKSFAIMVDDKEVAKSKNQ